MNTVEVNISKWTYLLAILVLLICISCTKEELTEEENLGAELMHVDHQQDTNKPPTYTP